MDFFRAPVRAADCKKKMQQVRVYCSGTGCLRNLECAECANKFPDSVALAIELLPALNYSFRSFLHLGNFPHSTTSVEWSREPMRAVFISYRRDDSEGQAAAYTTIWFGVLAATRSSWM
jgi:hypothetical protein